jgi:hypothetical protein
MLYFLSREVISEDSPFNEMERPLRLDFAFNKYSNY